jgi:hypothetical protein
MTSTQVLKVKVTVTLKTAQGRLKIAVFFENADFLAK